MSMFTGTRVVKYIDVDDNPNLQEPEDEKRNNRARCLLIGIGLTLFLGGAWAYYFFCVQMASDSDSTSSSSSESSSTTTAPSQSDDTVEYEKYNIVTIMADDIGWADISTYAGIIRPYDQFFTTLTPRLDKIFENGVTFTNYHSNAVCSPSRASFYTGRYVHNLGFQSTNVLQYCQTATLPMWIPTWAELLKEKGYTNHFVGKWHVGMKSWANTPIGRGWDTWEGSLNHPRGMGRTTCEWTRIHTARELILGEPNLSKAVDVYEKCLGVCSGYYYAVYQGPSSSEEYPFDRSSYDNEHAECMCFTESNRPQEVYYSDANVTSATAVSSFWSCDPFNITDWWYGDEPKAVPRGLSADDMIMLRVQDLLLSNDSLPEPFSVNIALTTPHADYTFPPNGTGSFIYAPCMHFFDYMDAGYNYNRGAQCQRLFELDTNIGAVVDMLKYSGRWENTILMVTNDNGAEPGQITTSEPNYGLNTPLRGQKTTHYQGGIRTFMGIWGGALPHHYIGQVIDRTHDVTDVMPTILSAAGYNASELEDLPMDGTPLINFVDTVHDSGTYSDLPAHTVIYHWMPNFVQTPGSGYLNYNGSVVRIGGWKYFSGDYMSYQVQATGAWETLPQDETKTSNYECDQTYGCFYNVAADPYELTCTNATDMPDGMLEKFTEAIDDALDSEDYLPGYSLVKSEACLEGALTVGEAGRTYYPPWE